MVNERLDRLKAGVIDETKKLFGVFVYLWVLLTLFSLHKAFIFNEDILTYQQGFALINALALAKIVVVGQALHVGDRSKDKPLVYPILSKSAIFATILILFHVVEELVIGVWHGKAVAEAIPTLGDGTLQSILMIAIILFVALIPFFAFIELERVIGPEELHTLLFGRKTSRVAGTHVEKHFLNSETVRDVVIGMADELTVPFALAAGISAAVASTRIVVTAGLAEIVAGSIAMGLGIASLSSSWSVVLVSDFITVSTVDSTVFSVVVFRVVTSISSTVEPGLSQTCPSISARKKSPTNGIGSMVTDLVRLPVCRRFPFKSR